MFCQGNYVMIGFIYIYKENQCVMFRIFCYYILLLRHQNIFDWENLTKVLPEVDFPFHECDWRLRGNNCPVPLPPCISSHQLPWVLQLSKETVCKRLDLDLSVISSQPPGTLMERKIHFGKYLVRFSHSNSCSFRFIGNN